MNTKDTTIKAVKKGLSVAVATSLVVFGFIYILMVCDDLLSAERFEKALDIAGSYFGGIATLAAAYIASLLFNDWRIQHNKQIKDQYFLEILSIMRTNLISFAPILNHLINACENYTYKDIVIDLQYNSEVIETIYSSHKTVALLFKEYHYTFNDDETYLVYLKFYNLIEKLIPILLGINKINNVDKIEELTRQLHIISFPIELMNGIAIKHYSNEILPIDMCRYVEHYYFNLVKQIASLKLAK